jgi:parallel beta-helix repeat protein
MNRNIRSAASLLGLCAALIAGTGKPAGATTWCVNPGGTAGCFAKIGLAVSAAMPTDTINVAIGTYKEDVVIGKPLSLVGANARGTIIDATGLPNGIYIDGFDNPGLSEVVVTGFTVKNANFEGILVTNASFVTLSGNDVTNNNAGLNTSTATCSGLPALETSEGEDCGEGIHLIGVDHSILANNTSENNAGGILLSDETAATHDNVLTGNMVRNNPFDCGITLASHPPAAGGSPLGIVHNTIANNVSLHNGYQVPGAGAGVGIFTFLPGGTVTGNVVINNRLMNNGLPGVAMHAHSPGENLNDNIIVANEISGNGADTGDTVTPGPTGINLNSGFGGTHITGTVIAENVIDREAYDLFINTPPQVDAHLNGFIGYGAVGVDNSSGGAVNVTENYWGCLGGPGAEGCTTVEGPGVVFTPWLIFPFGPNGFF